MKAKLLTILMVLLLWIGLSDTSRAQSPYWVRFIDKTVIQEQHDPYAIPIPEEYIQVINNMGISVIGTSRWLNLAMVEISRRQMKILQSLPCVKELRPVREVQSKLAFIGSHDSDFGPLLDQQLNWFEYPMIKEKGLTGKGIRIAIFDGGFPGVNSHAAFRHLFEHDKIIATWNFPENSSSVYRNHPHGTAVLSCITGNKEGKPSGLAPDAEFLLARTELDGEPWREQLFWIQAAEWAEKNGANIICSSLGYTFHHYFPEEMDGSSPVAEAARIASEKGILVINSIGNDGESKWKIPGTPADAVEVLSVGGIDPETGLKSSFSSFGPNASGQMKPNVVAPSKVLAATRDGWKVMHGTSFATPLVAGYAACIWEMHPEMSNRDIFELIQFSGNLHPYYDYAHGYGVPQISKLIDLPKPSGANNLIVHSKSGLIIVKTRGVPGQNPYLYYHLSDQTGRLLEYKVIDVRSGDQIGIDTKEYPNLSKIRIRYGTTVKSLTIKNE
ncbi:MAG: S8 family serine peptidase, partial [Bacteroidetes bacterium]|nr:S8 family serine peptidase [Bacteroidota bacterium]